MNLPKYFYFRVNPINHGTGVELEDASNVDVAEVMRCKDCAHYDGQWCYWNGHYLKDNDFCRRAERIKGDAE